MSDAHAPAAAVSITARNCMAVTGMSWAKAQAVARSHQVPVYRLSARCTVIPAAAFADALQRAAHATLPRDAVDEMLISIGVRKR